uniref:Uncharacterized protein n=1 Tax=Oryza meridionalis TaxID=40149 RepID=A0A0E0DB79_9ORYZ
MLANRATLGSHHNEIPAGCIQHLLTFPARSTNLVAQLKNSMIPLLMGIACARASCRQPSLAFSIDFYL